MSQVGHWTTFTSRHCLTNFSNPMQGTIEEIISRTERKWHALNLVDLNVL